MAAAAERWARAHRDELVQDLIGLIGIPSVARYGEGGFPMGIACQNALDHFGSLANKYGFSAESDENHSISVLMPGSTGRHELGILGHLDVVPEGTGWKYAPFSAIEKNGYVIGRGAMDNKGPLLMALYTLRCMRDLGLALNSTVRLIAGCDEEREMRDVQHYLKTHEPPDFTLNCDGAWAVGIGEKGILTADLTMPFESSLLISLDGGEASNMVPTAARAVLRGITHDQAAEAFGRQEWLSTHEEGGLVTLNVSGRASHCSAPHTGANAIRRLLKLLSGCGLFPAEEARKLTILSKAIAADDGFGLRISYADRLSGRTTCAATLLSLQENVLRLHINVRFAITQPPELLKKQLHTQCEKIGLHIENLSISPPRYTDPAQPEIALLMDTCHELISRRCQPYVSGGGTHSRIFPRSVPFGPGFVGKPAPNVLGGPHAADEAVCIEDLLQGVKVYTVALLRLDRLFRNAGHPPHQKTPAET